MKQYDNQNPNFPTTEEETYKIPTPGDLKEKLAKQGMKTAVLGEFENGLTGPYDKETYADRDKGGVPESQEVRDWAERKATLQNREDDEKLPTSELDGFTVKDSTQIDNEGVEDIDELPEDLDMGEPDSDEVSVEDLDVDLGDSDVEVQSDK